MRWITEKQYYKLQEIETSQTMKDYNFVSTDETMLGLIDA